MHHTQSSSFLCDYRFVKSLPTVTVHHMATATDMYTPVLVTWGVKRVKLVTILEHLPAGMGHHGRPLNKGRHNHSSSIDINLKLKTKMERSSQTRVFETCILWQWFIKVKLEKC